ncbi:hypothetical protein BOW35_12610 [Solemya velum gill symbiont]|nr:hypothetical protein BOW35_12610 [Solemya velum gill symbiont]
MIGSGFINDAAFIMILPRFGFYPYFNCFEFTLNRAKQQLKTDVRNAPKFSSSEKFLRFLIEYLLAHYEPF